MRYGEDIKDYREKKKILKKKKNNIEDDTDILK